jgi:uncharacterized protein (TIGR02145 family)
MNKLKFPIFAAALALAMLFTLSCSSGDDGGGISSPSNSKTECVLNLLADDSQTPANIMAVCEASKGEVLAHLPETIGDCRTADIEIGKTLGVIAGECGVEQIPIQRSSSSSKQNRSSSSNNGSGYFSSSSNGGGYSSSSRGSSSGGASSSSGNGYVPQFGTLTDARDSKVYKTTTIGTQTWMAEDLKFGKSYSDYNWTEAMNGDAYVPGADKGPNGLCPQGWHFPNNAEWIVLLNYVGGASVAGTKLKADSGWLAHDTYGNGTDDYGFSARSIYIYSDGDEACYLSSTQSDANNAYYRLIEYDSGEVTREVFPKSDKCQLRCVKN